MKSNFSFVVLLFFIFTISSSVEAKYPESVQTELVADSSLLETQGIIKIGVLYKLKPGWHIYWRNSGDSGLPTQIDFTLPEGFAAGELFWPVPEAFLRSGNVQDYGYEDEVLLWANVKVPKDYDIEDPLPVEVKTRWVSCEKLCIPGKAEMKSLLNEQSLSSNYDLFKKWELMLPGDNTDIDTTIKETKIDGENIIYTISLDFKEPVENVEFFPVPGKAFEIEDISYSDSDSMTKEIKFKLFKYPGKLPQSNHIYSVVAYTDENEDRKAVNFPIKVSE